MKINFTPQVCAAASGGMERIMKDNYNFNTMKRIPHPLLGKAKLVSNLGQLSDEEFEHKIQKFEPDERDIAIRLRERRRYNTNISV